MEEIYKRTRTKLIANGPGRVADPQSSDHFADDKSSPVHRPMRADEIGSLLVLVGRPWYAETVKVAALFLG